MQLTKQACQMKKISFLTICLISNLVFATVPEDESERLLGSLIAQGVICEGLNHAQQQKALTIYLQRRQRYYRIDKSNNLKYSVDNSRHENSICITPSNNPIEHTHKEDIDMFSDPN